MAPKKMMVQDNDANVNSGDETATSIVPVQGIAVEVEETAVEVPAEQSQQTEQVTVPNNEVISEVELQLNLTEEQKQQLVSAIAPKQSDPAPVPTKTSTSARFDTTPMNVNIVFNDKNFSLTLMRNDRFGTLRQLVIKHLGMKNSQKLTYQLLNGATFPKHPKTKGELSAGSFLYTFGVVDGCTVSISLNLGDGAGVQPPSQAAGSADGYITLSAPSANALEEEITSEEEVDEEVIDEEREDGKSEK